MPVGELCNREVVVTDRNTTVSEAAELMRRHHVGCLVVMDALQGPRKPVGILTDRDIVIEVVAKQVAPDTITVGEILREELKTVPASAGVFDTLRYMHDHGIRRMPVVDDAGQLVGIITLDDYLGLLSEEMTQLSKLIGNEQRRESKLRP